MVDLILIPLRHSRELCWQDAFIRGAEPYVPTIRGLVGGCPASRSGAGAPPSNRLTSSGFLLLHPPVRVPRTGVHPPRRSFLFLPRMSRCNLRRGSPGSARGSQAAPGAAERAEKPMRSAVQGGTTCTPQHSRNCKIPVFLLGVNERLIFILNDTSLPVIPCAGVVSAQSLRLWSLHIIKSSWRIPSQPRDRPKRG